jgi:hypothetical protein
MSFTATSASDAPAKLKTVHLACLYYAGNAKAAQSHFSRGFIGIIPAVRKVLFFLLNHAVP